MVSTTSAMASLLISMAPSTHCSASMSCGGVRSDSCEEPSRYGGITSARLTELLRYSSADSVESNVSSEPYEDPLTISWSDGEGQRLRIPATVRVRGALWRRFRRQLSTGPVDMLWVTRAQPVQDLRTDLGTVLAGLGDSCFD